MCIEVAAYFPAGMVPYMDTEDAIVVGANIWVEEVPHASCGTGTSWVAAEDPWHSV